MHVTPNRLKLPPVQSGSEGTNPQLDFLKDGERTVPRRDAKRNAGEEESEEPRRGGELNQRARFDPREHDRFFYRTAPPPLEPADRASETPGAQNAIEHSLPPSPQRTQIASPVKRGFVARSR